MFNDIDENFDNVTIRTFKVGLPTEHDLRKSLTRKPIRNVRKLMDCIDEYKRVEEDQQQGKGKTKVVPQDQRDFKSKRYNNSQPRRDFVGHSRSTTAQIVSTMFREPVHQILEKVKNESYFKWPNKMGGDPKKYNQSLHCQDHQDRGHTTEKCRTLWNHLEQLVKIGKLKQFLYQPSGQGSQARSEAQKDASLRPPLGTISAILAAPGRTSSLPSKSEVVEVNFIVIDAYSPYTAIVVRPWLHAMGAVSSTLHLKVKYRVEELFGSQSMDRQCLVAAIRHQIGGESPSSAKRDL